MHLKTYLLQRYFTLLLTISFLFTAVFNLIEFFEKLVRTSASLGTIATFIGLNLIPSWLTLLPISSWLAMLALIGLLQLNNEWHALDVLGIRPRALVPPFFIALTMSAGLLLLGKHVVFDQSQHALTRYYQTVFKKKERNSISDRWFWLPRMRYVHIGWYDQASKKGRDLTIYHYTATYHLKETTHLAQWHLDGDTIRAPEYALALPALAHALSLAMPPASWLTLARLWLRTPRAYRAHKAALGRTLAAHLMPLAELIVLPLLTLIIYLALPPLAVPALALAALSYPVWLVVKGVVRKLI